MMSSLQTAADVRTEGSETSAAGTEHIEVAVETVAEKIANAVTHGIGAILSIGALVAMVTLATIDRIPQALAPVAVFGSLLVLLYLVSTLYHAISHVRARRVLRFLDHASIYLVIAGTYTPVAMIALPGGPDWLMLSTVWTLALAGIALRWVYGERYAWFRISLYLAMGWLSVVWAGPIVSALGWDGSGLLAAGGVAYTAGVLFYAWEKLPFNHAIWHMFVIGGSAAHVLAIMYFVI
jgi:hemolysin III